MDAVEFFNELNRMCKNYSTDNCCDSSCPLYEIESNPNSIKGIALFNVMRTNPKRLVNIVEQWSKDHPRKTRLQDFKEKYPNGTFEKDSEIPHACCDDLGYCFCKSSNGGGPEGDCKKCWNEPVE